MTIWQIENEINEAETKLLRLQRTDKYAEIFAVTGRLKRLREERLKMLVKEGGDEMLPASNETNSWGIKTIMLSLTCAGLAVYYSDLFNAMHKDRSRYMKEGWENRVREFERSAERLREYLDDFFLLPGKKREMELAFDLTKHLYEHAYTDRERKIYDKYADKV